MLNNPYPNPHPKPHPNGYWFSSVSLFLFTHTLSNVYLSIHTPSVYLSTHIHTHSLYKHTLSLSLYTNSLNLSIHTPSPFLSTHTPSLYLYTYSLYLSTHEHSLCNLHTLSFSFSLFLHTHFLYHYTVHSLSMSVHRPPDFLSLNILRLSQWRTRGLPPGADLKFAAPRDFCLGAQNFFDDLFLASLSFAQLRLSCNPPKNFCSPSGLKILFSFQFFRYIPNFAALIAPPPLATPLLFPSTNTPSLYLYRQYFSALSLYLSTHTIPFSISLHTQSVFIERDTGTLCREIERVYVDR